MKGGSGIKKLIIAFGVAVGAAFIGMGIVAKKKHKDSIYENDRAQKNPLEGKKVVFVPNEDEPENADGTRGHLRAVGDSDYQPGFYDKYGKRAIDILLSGMGLIVLSPVLLGISLAIKIDDPGPVLFTQKRMGQNKRYFKLHKFRSMKMSTPHDVPTHMLDNPDQYITRVGKFLRLHSLDELPQIWDIFIGNMSIIGPRPALWNQDDLIAERDKYGANDILPGLTGWAQINGRDELEIEEKARLDGEYTEKLRQGGMKALFFDLKCLLGTVFSVLGSEGVVEGGTGELHKAEKRLDSVSAADSGFEDYGYLKHFDIDISEKNRKRVLITGAGSYIGESFERWAQQHYSANFTIDTLDMRNPDWSEKDFSVYDAVFHVAGIVHVGVGKVDEETKKKYYKVNTDLALETARKAKENGVRQFVFMSSMSVYGDSEPYGKEKIIDEYTVPVPSNLYGDSKWQADKGVRNLETENFRVAVLRPPMIYGKGCKGNYPVLAKLAKKLPIFPDVENRRSMLYIDNLCDFLCKLMLSGEGGVYFPQNREYIQTTEMAKKIGEVSGRPVKGSRMLVPAVAIGSKIPGKIGKLVDKAFGNYVYSHRLSRYCGLNYHVADFSKSIRQIEGMCMDKSVEEVLAGDDDNTCRKSVLVVAHVASMIVEFNIPAIKLLINLGYDVDVAANFKEGYTCTDEKVQKLSKLLDELSVDCYQIDFDRNAMNLIANAKTYKQLEAVVKGNAIPVNAVRHHYVNLKQGYTFIHSHSPIGGVIGRMVAKKHCIKSIYTAHGFHFYKGAPLKNWLLFYPIERYCSRWTDVLITINREDFALAKRHMKAKKVVYVPGMGVDIERFQCAEVDKERKRTELGVAQGDFLLLSVGELNRNKNHEIVIRAIAELEEPGIHYVIAGKGDFAGALANLAGELGVQRQVHLLGYYDDVATLYKCANLYLLPSIREGLNVSLMEAMASGLPVICSAIRGNKDLVMDGKGGFLCQATNKDDFVVAIKKMRVQREMAVHMGQCNQEKVKAFAISNVMEKMRKIYEDI